MKEIVKEVSSIDMNCNRISECLLYSNVDLLVHSHFQRIKTHRTNAWGYSWGTLILEEINMETWPSKLGESQIRESTIWGSAGLTALATPSNNCKLQTRPLDREGSPHQQTHNCLKIIIKEEKLVTGPRRVHDSKTDWQTDLWS
jgi:hypothetical protein